MCNYVPHPYRNDYYNSSFNFMVLMKLHSLELRNLLIPRGKRAFNKHLRALFQHLFRLLGACWLRAHTIWALDCMTIAPEIQYMSWIEPIKAELQAWDSCLIMKICLYPLLENATVSRWGNENQCDTFKNSSTL